MRNYELHDSWEFAGTGIEESSALYDEPKNYRSKGRN
jgi:hypothetical protein